MFHDFDEELTEFKEDLAANMAYLEAGIGLLKDAEERRFARSLCDWYDRYSSLSSKQAYRAWQLWAQVNHERGVSRPSMGGKPVAEEKKVPDAPIVRIDGSKVIALFDKAAEELKYPSVKYWVDKNDIIAGVEEIKFYRNVKQPLTGCVSAIWKEPGNNIGYDQRPVHTLCTIARDGTTKFGRFCFDKPPLQQLLKRVIEDFVKEMVVSGKRCGNCCFCGLELTAAPSLAAGYGPICATKYGLPWGDDGSLPANFEPEVML